MNNIKSLADQLRIKMAAPDIPLTQGKNGKKKLGAAKSSSPTDQSDSHQLSADILQDINLYDNSNHKNMVHVRFDEKTAQLLNHFKMATGVEITKLVAFSVHSLFQSNPELKSIIKQFIKKIEL